MKKTGYIIYQRTEEAKNRKFVEMFQRAGQQYGLEFTSHTIENYQSLPRPDFVLNRTRDYHVSEYYERQDVSVFHRAEVVRIGNDKAETLRVLKQNWKGSGTLCVPKSLVLMPEDSETQSGFWDRINAWRDDNGLTGHPLVIKAVDGHGGREVFLSEGTKKTRDGSGFSAGGNVLCEAEEKKCLPEILAGKKLLCQQMIDSAGRDVRVYILGGKIYHAVLRQGREDFRSNYSLGGRVSEYALSQEERRQVQDYVDCLGGKNLAMAGIDFLLDKQGKLVFNELEEMVGSRMLYACSHKEIVSDYVVWLAQTL